MTDTFKSRLKFYMDLNKLNPTSLSRKAGLNVTAVRDILKHDGTPNPRIDTFVKICAALGINPIQLSPDLETLCKTFQVAIIPEKKTTDGTKSYKGAAPCCDH